MGAAGGIVLWSLAKKPLCDNHLAAAAFGVCHVHVWAGIGLKILFEYFLSVSRLRWLFAVSEGGDGIEGRRRTNGSTGWYADF